MLKSCVRRWYEDFVKAFCEAGGWGDKNCLRVPFIYFCAFV